MVNHHVIQIPAAVPHGDDAHAQLEVVGLQQRQVRAGADAVNRDAINVEAEIGKVRREILYRDARVERVTELLLGRRQNVIVEALAAQQDGHRRRQQQNQSNHHGARPQHDFLPARATTRRWNRLWSGLGKIDVAYRHV